jgi:hypothetical protein
MHSVIAQGDKTNMSSDPCDVTKLASLMFQRIHDTTIINGLVDSEIRNHILERLERSQFFVRFEVSTAVTMKNVVF